ncbi:MAG: osmotically-inducible protein OsmY [Porticoccaceae bacterium]|jgi:osmotically-inducible protein OsmY
MPITKNACSARTPQQTVHALNPVLAEVKRRLGESPYSAIKQIQLEFYEGVLILRGKVPTFYTRQVALALAMTVDGVELVDDRISVQ